MTPHLEQFQSYEQACKEFVWQIPDSFNIATEVCRRHADPITRIALVETRSGGHNTYTFGGLDYLSDKFAVVLADSGVKRGDVVALNLAQSAAFAIALLGILKAGAIVAPISDSTDSTGVFKRAKFIVIDRAKRKDPENRLRGGQSPPVVFVADDDIHRHSVADGERSFWRDVYKATSDFHSVETKVSDPAFLVIAANIDGTSDEFVINHGSLLAGLPAFEMWNDLDLRENQIFWADRHWTVSHALAGFILPAWYYGHSVVAARSIDIETAGGTLGFLDRCEITTALLAASQLHSIATRSQPKSSFDLPLNRILTLNECITDQLTDWAEENLGARVSAAYASSRDGVVAADCGKWFASKEGFLGRPAPGYRVAIIDDSGVSVPPGLVGGIAIQSNLPFPSVAESNRNTTSFQDCHMTGDEGAIEDGYLTLTHQYLIHS
jgi:acetyl-CoA synthetase